MSDAPATKKSILTDAMERVQAKMNAETTDEQEPTTEKRFFNKKNFIRLGAAAVLATAAVYAVKNATKAADEETSEEANTED